jgi:outer membrane receptor protein involved in Fe transport
LLLAAASAVASAESSGYAGLELEQALERLEAQGLAIVYSSDLVKPGMKIAAEPAGRDPRALLAEIVSPFGLAVTEGPGSTLMLVRAPAALLPTSPPPPKPLDQARALDEIIVSASRYRLAVGPLASAVELTAADIALLPVLGDDPLRAIARLPGVAHQDFTSKSNIRGGVDDETLVSFDGLRLYNAFHLKDFQSLFSSIDPGLVGGLTVYTAGFPVTYGDRMGSVIEITPIEPGEKLQGQLAASFFNLSGLVGGSFDSDAGHWLASARRGNLDLVLDVSDSNLGEPKYSDLHAHVDYQLANGWLVEGNVLTFEDDLRVSDRDEEEVATAEYRDEYFWLRLGHDRSAAAGGRMQLARARLSNDRAGSADLPGVGSGTLLDRSSFTIDSLQADAWRRFGTATVLEAGAEWRRSNGRYDYQDEARFEMLFLTPGAPTAAIRARTVSLRPEGEQYAAYLNARLEPWPGVTAEAGLRWDRETLSDDGSDRLSPRLGLLWQASARTRLRVGWGRYFQAQAIDELPVSDGESEFSPAQRAEHWIASVEQRLTADLDLRVEAYRKDYERLRPRFENLLNPLVVLPELKPDRIRIEPDSATAEGVELSINYGSGGPRTAWLSYSLSRVEDRVASDRIDRSWDQTHFISAGAARRGPRWEVSLAAAWHSGWPTTAVELATLEPFPLVAAGPRNDERLGSYARFDARLARRFHFDSQQQLTVFLEVSNLTNRGNDCCVEYQIETEDGPAFLDVAPVKSLPLVPSLGFVWEF